MAQLNAAAAEFMKESPIYQAYVSVAPEPDHFPQLIDKMADLLWQEYDWSSEVAALKMPTLLVFGDADSMSPAYAAQFFELLGGGKIDVGWDGAAMPSARLAIIPATTHYNISSSPLLAPVVTPFLDAALLQEVS